MTIKPGLSIVIPCRNDPLIRFTVKRIHETASGEYEVIVVDDGSEQRSHFDGINANVIRNSTSEGVDRATDRGVEAASYDVVLKLDAHMNFPEQDWMGFIVNYVRNNPRDICCTICPQLAEDRLEMELSTGAHYGAHIQLRADPVSLEVSESGMYRAVEYRRVLSNRWNSDPALKALVDSGEVVPTGCILGASYAFLRARYMNDLRRPWKVMRGWGSGEQTLSLANYLLGGRSVILPIRIGHVFRSDPSAAPYSTDVGDMIYNNLRLAHLVFDESTLQREVEWILTPWRGSSVESHAMACLNDCSWKHYRDYLRSGPVTWEDYQYEWMGESTVSIV